MEITQEEISEFKIKINLVLKEMSLKMTLEVIKLPVINKSANGESITGFMDIPQIKLLKIQNEDIKEDK